MKDRGRLKRSAGLVGPLLVLLFLQEPGALNACSGSLLRIANRVALAQVGVPGIDPRSAPLDQATAAICCSGSPVDSAATTLDTTMAPAVVQRVLPLVHARGSVAGTTSAGQRRAVADSRSSARFGAQIRLASFSDQPHLLSAVTSGHATVAVGGRVSASDLVPAATGGFGQSRAALVWSLAGIFLALLVVILLLGSTGGSRERAGGRQRRLLSLYTLTGRPASVKQPTAVLGESQIAQSALELAGRFVRKRGLEERLALRLDRAAVPIRANEWILLVAGCIIGSFLLSFLFFGSGSTALLFGVLAGVIPGRWLSFKANRRRNAFEENLPDALQLLSGSLSAGFSLPQAVDAVAREGSQPIAGEFGRAVAEARLGIPVEESLDNLAQRMDSQNFHWVVMAVRTQREVGGNLAEVLAIVSQTMRDRAKLQRQVRALSAEGRLSAYVLIGLPIGMGFYLFVFRRQYIAPLYSELLGIIMLSLAVLLLGIGWIWMRKIIKVEV